MTLQQLSKVWAVVSVFLLYYALNSYLVTQGGETIFGATLIMKTRVPDGFLAIPICSVLLLVSASIGIAHARRTGPSWSDRVPLVGFEQLDTTRVEAKLYQAAMLFLLSALPTLTFIHFWGVAASAEVVTTAKQPTIVAGGIWDWSALTSLNHPATICTNVQVGPPLVCEGRTTILPGLEPAIFAALTVAAVCATLAFWWFVIAGKKAQQADSHLLTETSTTV